MKKKFPKFLSLKSRKNKDQNVNSTDKKLKTAKIENEMIGIIVILLSIFIFLSLFTRGNGYMGKIFRYSICGMFGFSSFLLPFIVLFLGVKYFISDEQKTIGSKLFDTLAIISAVSILIVLFYYDSISLREMSIMENINYSFKNGAEKMGGGGVIGEMFCIILVNLIGKTGSWVISIGLVLIFILVFTETSIQVAINKMCSKIKLFCIDIIKKIEGIIKVKKNKKIFSKCLSDNEQEIDCKNYEINKIFGKVQEKKMDKSFLGDEQENGYKLPPTTILNKPSPNITSINKKILKEKADKLINTLKSFGVEATITNISCGPTVTRFELFPGFGVKVNKITNLSDDIALSLAALSVRIEAPIPGKSAIGVEIPNEGSADVPVRDVIDTDEFKNFNSKVAFAIGKDISGNCIISDISKFPHVLIAGATGSGKSVCINSLITSVLYKARPDEVKFIMIDPKMVELGVYNGIPHLLVPVVTNAKKAAGALNWAVVEMQNRYRLFSENSVRNLNGYNELMRKNEKLSALIPEIIIIIDELADLMMVAKDEVEDAINRLAALARAAGMYLVIATQRPSVNVITGVIKANVPSRISFAVTSQVDSRTIIDSIGAEKLLGRGDMLYYPCGASKPLRVQGNFVSDSEVENLVDYVKKQSLVTYNEGFLEQLKSEDENLEKKRKKSVNTKIDEEIFSEAIRFCEEMDEISAAILQRELEIDYLQAKKMIEKLEEENFVGPNNGSGLRKVLITRKEKEINSEGNT
ncbi:MAG: DNA translocase FtsK [Clostridiales bacterium]|nr:DNA translocase FtsK [Clostridiales bacterium]